eukprot:c12336_g2_i1 orf=2-2101(-)
MEARTTGSGCFYGGLEKLCKTGQLMEVFHRVDCALREGYHVSNKLFYALLKRCIDEEDLAAGKELHKLILRSGADVNSFLNSHLIRMFASCGSLSDANRIFDTIQKPNVFSWSAILAAHVKFGQNGKAINLYQQMNHSDVQPDGHVFVAALKACGSGNLYKQGKWIHIDILVGGFDSGLHVANAVVDMYCKWGSMLDGLRVFDRMQRKDLVTWNTMLSGCARHGYCDEALDLFKRMQHEGVKPNITTWNALISGYAQQGQAHEASRLVCDMKEIGIEPDNATWNGLIAGYAQCGLFEESLSASRQMQVEGGKPNYITLLCILSAYVKKGTLAEDMQSRALQLLEPISTCDIWGESNLVEPISTCDIGGESNLVDMARSVFDSLQRRPLEAWNAMITAYAEHEGGFEALHLFEQMLHQGTQPNSVTFLGVLKACLGASCLDRIKLIHATSVENEFDKDMLVGSSLVNTYAKCGSLDNACNVFEGLPERDVVTWTVMIAGYTQHGLYIHALEQLYKMQCEGVDPNRVTFLFYLKACSSLASLEFGLLGHTLIVMCGCESDAYVGSTLIDMYAKCESFSDAQSVFKSFPTRLPVTWNVMIVGCAQCNQSWEALYLFQQMQQAGLKPNQTTYLSILKVCTTLASLNQGKLLHASSIEAGFHLDVHVCSALVDMYAKCGSIEDAYKVFVGMPARDIVAWNAMIAG